MGHDHQHTGNCCGKKSPLLNLFFTIVGVVMAGAVAYWAFAFLKQMRANTSGKQAQLSQLEQRA